MAPDLERYRGQWVAFDEATQTVLVAADSDEELYEILDSEEFPRITVMRIPRLDEPVFIGLG